MTKTRLLAAMALATLPLTANADPAPLKIGFLSSFSGPVANITHEQFDGFNLALAEAGNRMGGRPIEVVPGDDEEKPDIGRSVADKMLQSDRVAIITGFNLSNVLLAVAKPALEAGAFVISPNAGPSQYAGKGCQPHMFFVSHQNDALFQSVGLMLNERKVPNAFLLAPNYPAGRDMMNGFKRTYTGTLKGETYTTLGAMDYASTIAEIRAAQPAAVMTFMPGGPGINFLKQYAASGLNATIPVYSSTGLVDESTLPAIGASAIGVRISTNWLADLDNPANKAFVADFTKTYNRPPSPFAATAYDTARAIGAALAAVGGNIDDKRAFQTAMEAASFASVRGHFAFNTNHFPIQTMYAAVIVADAQGKPVPRLDGVIEDNARDVFAPECHMPADQS
jgi:branched-chain amino acid transport system substrate-binding protein